MPPSVSRVLYTIGPAPVGAVADDPAVVVAAVAGQAAQGHVDRVVREREGASLLLHPWVHALHVKAAVPQHLAVGGVDRVQRVPKRPCQLGRDVEHATAAVVDGGAGDAQRVDVPAGQSRAADGRAQVALPDHLAPAQRVHRVVLGRRDNGPAHDQGRRVDGAVEMAAPDDPGLAERRTGGVDPVGELVR